LLELSRELFELKDFLSHKAQGVVRVSVPKIFSVLFIDKWIPEFLRMYPDLSVRFDFDVDEGGVDFSQADICVRVTDSPPPGLIGRKLFEVRYIPCASPQYIERHGTPAHPADLVAHSCIPLAGNVETERWDFSRQGEFCSTAVTGRYCSNDSEAMLKATFGGVGISCLPSVTAEQAIADGRLCRVLPDWEYTGSSQGMAWLLYQPGRHVSLRLKVMIDYLLVKLLRPSG
jgi:DNA-binding transcriptional LysR family regulator